MGKYIKIYGESFAVLVDLLHIKCASLQFDSHVYEGKAVIYLSYITGDDHISIPMPSNEDGELQFKKIEEKLSEIA